MNKQTYVLVGIALVLATLYIVNFTDVLKHENIQIHSTISRANPGAAGFILDKEYPLTSIKVVSVEDARTNKFPHAFWHVISAGISKTNATKEFLYGEAIPGMKPEVATALPETLQRGVDYNIMIESGKSLKGEKTFSLP